MKLRNESIEWPDPPSGNLTYKLEGDFNILTVATINFNVEQSEWCGYKGECKKNMAQTWDICYICKYRKELDIPAMLDKAYEEQHNSKDKK